MIALPRYHEGSIVKVHDDIVKVARRFMIFIVSLGCELGDGGMETRAWGLEHGDGSMGIRAWGLEHKGRSMGTIESG